MASISIEILPNPAPDHENLLEYSARLKALRLRSLKEDPGSFISKYESEVVQPEAFWLNRLRDGRAIHLILTRDNSATPGPNFVHKEWVGFVVIIAPTHKIDVAEPFDPAWEMAALYITPEIRGQGWGKMLVMATLEYVREHGFGEAHELPHCLTGVRHGNDNALELYQRLGFLVINPNEHVEKEGRAYLATQLKYQFPHQDK